MTKNASGLYGKLTRCVAVAVMFVGYCLGSLAAPAVAAVKGRGGGVVVRGRGLTTAKKTNSNQLQIKNIPTGPGDDINMKPKNPAASKKEQTKRSGSGNGRPAGSGGGRPAGSGGGKN